MKIRAYQTFRRAYSELPLKIQTKVDKQISLLSENIHHPSLRAKKIKGCRSSLVLLIGSFAGEAT